MISWINGWMMIAQAVRAAIPLGLMRNDPGPMMSRVVKPGHSLLPPPGGDWDREERRTLMFTVLMFDINASASSGWPNMMMVDELVSFTPRFPFVVQASEAYGVSTPSYLAVVPNLRNL